MMMLYDEARAAGLLVSIMVAATSLALFAVIRAVQLARREVITVEARRPIAALMSLAVIGIALLPVALVLTIRTCHSEFVTALHAVEQSKVAVDALRTAVDDSIQTAPFGLFMLWPLPLFIGVVALVLLVGVLWRAPDTSRSRYAFPWWAQGLAACAWTYICLMLPAAGIAVFNAELIKALSQVAGHREAALATAIEDGGRTVLAHVWVAYVGIAVTTVAAIAAVFLGRAPERASTRTRFNREWVVGTGCLIAALALLRITAPYRVENRNPISGNTVRVSVSLPEPTVRLPDLVGSDPVDAMPLVQLDDTRLLLDGRPVKLDEIAEDLGVLRAHWSTLHPDEPFPGGVAAFCDKSTKPSRFDDVMQRVHSAGYDRVWLLFGRNHTFDRPLLGKLTRSRFTAAELRLTTSADALIKDEVPQTSATDFESYDELAARVVYLRGLGEPTGFQLSASNPPPPLP